MEKVAPIYLDHAAATTVRPAAWEAMRPWVAGPAGNPASAHAAGRRARRALEDARERVAALLGASPGEVVFTSGATEANNLAVFGLAGSGPGHAVTTGLEHPCVSEPLVQLAGRGFTVQRAGVDDSGVADADAVRALVRADTKLVALMLVNHETGTIQPAERLADLTVPVHCDAAQAVGKVPVHFGRLGVATLALSGHKFGAPVGVGALLVRRCTVVAPQLFGGHQQAGRRPGTESVALAVALAAALAEADAEREAEAVRLTVLRARFLDRLRTEAGPITVNGDSARAVPHVLNVSFGGCPSDALLAALDLAGVSASAGAACSSGSLLPSPVLRAMGLPDERLRTAVRFSFGATTTAAEIERAADVIVRTAKRVRSVA